MHLLPILIFDFCRFTLCDLIAREIGKSIVRIQKAKTALRINTSAMRLASTENKTEIGGIQFLRPVVLQSLDRSKSKFDSLPLTVTLTFPSSL